MKKKEKTPKVRKHIQIQFLTEILGALGVFVFIAALFVLLGLASRLSREIMEKRSNVINTVSKEAAEVAKSRLETNSQKITELENLFVDDNDIVDFAKEIGTMKNEGAITSFVFTADNVINDSKTNYKIVPFQITIEGDSGRINYVMNKIMSLPYFVVDVIVEIEKNDSGGYIFNYGGYLYASEDF